jgi:hypothetical protein
MVQIHSPRPLPKSCPFNALRDVFDFTCFVNLWTNVDQFKAESDALSPFLPKCHVIL